MKISVGLAHFLMMCAVPAFLFAQANNPQTAGSTPAQPAPTVRTHVARWLDIQNATLNLRYRFIDNSRRQWSRPTRSSTARSIQQSRMKFDPAGQLLVGTAGVFTGARFYQRVGQYRRGVLADAQRNFAFKGMFLLGDSRARRRGTIRRVCISSEVNRAS